jgi:tetratricopeptide (TPR) repeat protein
LPHATPEESRPASALSIREEPAVLIPATEGAGNSLRRRLEKDYLQGKTALDHEEYPRALVAFTAVLELDPNHRDARNSLLETKRKMQRGILDYEGRWRTAQKKQALVDEMFALREILKLNPNHPQARAAWEKAREPNSPVIDQLYRIGVNAYAKKEYLLAQQAWDLLLDLNSYHKKAQESLARVEEKLQIINQQ